MKYFAIIFFSLFFTSFFSPVTQAESVPAFLTQEKTSIWMNSDNMIAETILYSCSSLEDKTQSILEKLGATSISVRCYGDGDPTRVSYSPTLELKFNATRLPSLRRSGPPSTGTWTNVSFKGFNDCDTTYQILAGVKDQFDTQGFMTRNPCNTNDDGYDFSFLVLSPNAGH